MKISPTLTEVKEIAKTGKYDILPVSCEILSDFITPIEAMRILQNVSTHCYLLESAQANEAWGRYTFLGYDPKLEINCNDIYSSGAEPMGVLLTVLLPPESEEALLEEMMSGAIRAAEERNIEILGGHTEVTDAVVKPVISAAVIGKTRNRKILSTGGAKAGQDVIMTKWAGTEGTAILAKEWEEGLRQYLTEEELQNAQAMKAYLSVGKESEIAFAYGATAMHDATEGGVLGAVWEVAECSGLGVDVFVEKIPVKEETKKICKAMGIDYLGLISSGTMIIAAENGEKLAERLQEEGIAAAVIGKLTESGRYMLVNDMRLPLAQPKSDALYEAKL